MPARPESSINDSSLSVIGSGMKVVGDIETSGVVKIDGTVEGSVRGAKQLLLGRTGVVHGDIHAEEAVLSGKIVGTINTAVRVEIQSTCSVQGDVQTKSIVILEGGVINGTVRMDAGTSRVTPTSPRTALSLSQ
jgi:cytoskeletal protein CcmA (bactofilin family)